MSVSVVYGNDATVTVSVNDARATGTVTIIFNGKKFNATLSNGIATVSIDCDDWNSGVYGFNVTYGGDGNFANASSVDYKLNITKASVIVSGANVSVVYGNDATVVITVNDTRATGKVIVHVNGKEFNATLNKGNATVTIVCDDWKVDNYTFYVTYGGG